MNKTFLIDLLSIYLSKKSGTTLTSKVRCTDFQSTNRTLCTQKPDWANQIDFMPQIYERKVHILCKHVCTWSDFTNIKRTRCAPAIHKMRT